MKTKKEKWQVYGCSESGDRYDTVIYNRKPTTDDLRNYILNETPEEIDIGGPGEFGSYVYLNVKKL